MGNIIGIKLADGSFYPVMEEGKPFIKNLELTTVKDNQTTVQLDLYRSATGTMEDAEYVDTLMIENLVPHPKQQNTLNLKIDLDENNMLHAEIDDPETGASTNSKVSLINLNKEELLEEPDYALGSVGTVVGGIATAVGGAVLANELLNDEKEEIIPTIEEDILEDLEPTFLDNLEENIPEEIDLSIPDESTLDSDLSFDNAELTTESDLSFDNAESTLDSDLSFDNAELATESDLSFDNAELATDSDFSFDNTELTTENDLSFDNFAEGDATLSETELANVSAGIVATQVDDNYSLISEELPSFDNFEIEEPAASSFDLEDDAPFSFDSLPEFDEIPELKDNSSESLDLSDFELPDFDSEPSFSPSGEDALFDGLYEESYKETEKIKKKTTIPVIVCVICALICVGAVFAIFWLTKPNLFGKTTEMEEEVSVVLPIEKVEEKLPIEEPPIVEDLTAAKVDEIVITPEPVVPEIPKPKEEIVPNDVIYRIKWGDTLWDLAESYYQNPWLYKKIAKANNIKNPDVIISGTDIVIPPLN